MDKFVRILENDDLIVNYDRERGMYQVNYFKDNHFVDGICFDAYEKEEIKKLEDKIDGLEMDLEYYNDW